MRPITGRMPLPVETPEEVDGHQPPSGSGNFGRPLGIALVVWILYAVLRLPE